jgi:hypothetical protein
MGERGSGLTVPEQHGPNFAFEGLFPHQKKDSVRQLGRFPARETVLKGLVYPRVQYVDPPVARRPVRCAGATRHLRVLLQTLPLTRLRPDGAPAGQPGAPKANPHVEDWTL